MTKGALCVFVFVILSEVLCGGGLLYLDRVKQIHYEPFNPVGKERTHRKDERELRMVEAAEIPRAHHVMGEQIPNYQNPTKFNAYLGWKMLNPRGRENWDSNLKTDKIRMWAFGDSFTYANEVPYDETWGAMLESNSPQVEVINFGTLGYGLDQAYLHFKQESQKSDNYAIVLICFSPAMYERNTRFFHLSTLKPRFILKGDELELVEIPIRSYEERVDFLNDPERITRYGKYDYNFQKDFAGMYRKGPLDFLATVRFFKVSWFHNRYYQGTLDTHYKKVAFNPESETFIITRKIVDMFYSEVKKKGKIPLIVLLPLPRDIFIHQKTALLSYQPLKDHLDRMGYKYIDPMPYFAHYLRSGLFRDLYLVSHYSPISNQIIAMAIRDWFKKRP